ncbi:type IV toxin-antitoxin system AbiEi family antitoxin domain-containing protein [Pediococcus argentinicus]|uniref:Abortive infection protein AbiGI n=1 Tax=Pediococcus argentinicus TaxID=480391 RepID=A0A0R2N952_9LACO|nr:type IV toxin-antitoxin system AbiEi family antitoxin domain-containing protein [Pediococcus argentinicus]KRO22383.1 abortive infection protein AbiGI [Pediococcus argentinicus]NKZ22879.1 abortive infection protein [Pediococcus argentinicus]GEP20155.1 transcriptional regulator [Pediococcus argentinicus]
MKTDMVMELLKENNGLITGAMAKSIGISLQVLNYLVQKGELERIDRGVYINPNIFEDDMYTIQYRFKKGIYSRDTALFLHGMIDRTPSFYQMNFPVGYHSALIEKYPIQVSHQIEKLYSLGIEEVQSPGGHKIQTYNIERTLCDLVRTKSSDAETIKQAMNEYVKMNNKNLQRLIEYADILKVKEKIRTYMEVLL